MVTTIENIESSSLESMEYDSDTETLTVEFVSGIIYEYLSVPPTEFESLSEADSKGKHLNEHIKGTYNYEKL